MEFNRLLVLLFQHMANQNLSIKNIDINAKEKQQTISKKNYYLIKNDK